MRKAENDFKAKKGMVHQGHERSTGQIKAAELEQTFTRLRDYSEISLLDALIDEVPEMLPRRTSPTTSTRGSACAQS